MSRYIEPKKEKPEDRKEEKKLLTREHLEKGRKTPKGEKQALLGVRSKKKK